MIIDSIKTPWRVPEEDLLDRQKYADFLTGYLSGQESSFVLNLNAEWGMGKTYFLTNWCKSLEGKHPTVYVNAWKDDFSDDPLLGVMSSINEQLAPLMPKADQATDKLKNMAIASGRFIKGLLPILSKGLVNKLLGDKADEDISNLITDGAISDMAGKSMQLMLASHSSTTQSVIDFQDILEEIIGDITRKDSAKPLFIFIDELDRCRPTYAIELLEIVKHLFSVPNVVFIIATDSNQLQHSIKAIYGNDFDGREYLRRFFDQEYTLPTPDYYKYCQCMAENLNFLDKLKYWNFSPWCLNGEIVQKPNDWSNKDSFKVFLTLYAKYFELSLRSVNQVLVRLEAILSNSEEQWDGPLLIFLLMVQAMNNTLISKLRKSCNRNNYNKNIKYWEETFPDKGTTIRWFQRARYGDAGNDTFLKITDICKNYIVSIGQIHNSNDKALNEHTANNNYQLSSFLISNLAHKKLSVDHDFPDLYTYFDHIEMAGALS